MVDRFLEAIAADEPHGVIGAAVVVSAQSVDRDDPGMLEPAGDLGLGEESESADRVVGTMVEDLLEGDLAVSSESRATKTAPRPPRAWGRRTWNR